MIVLALWPRVDTKLCTELAASGVAIRFASSLQVWLAEYEKVQPDLLLIDPAMIHDESLLKPDMPTPMILLPATACDDPDQPLPMWVRASLAQAIRQVRTRSAIQGRHEVEQQLAMGFQQITDAHQRLATAHTDTDAMHHLMQWACFT